MPSSYKRRVRIVCTLGPSTHYYDRISGLIKEGMDVARLNFSHGTHDFHLETIQTIQKASRQHKRPVAILQDLQGPKIRLGTLPKGGTDVKSGDTVLLYPEGSTPKTSTKSKILLPISAEIAESVSRDTKKGARILFDDGKVITHVTQVSTPELVVEVEIGGHLSDHKGMNLPGTPLSIPCLTKKDLDDLKFGLSQGVDAIALSFVRSPDDIEDLKARIKKISNHMPLIIAKMEREEAIENQEQIIEVADGLMVARGDMAVEIGAERVPTVQKQLIASCNELGVSVITATQMLESMIESPTPTRAEASDVANAVYDGTDAVMLSAETASGKFPLETVRTMARIILEAERFSERHTLQRSSRPTEVEVIPGSVVDAVEASAATIARQIDARVIACLTHSGMAARTLSKFRPSQPIVAIMDNESMLRRLSFMWGIHGVIIPKILATDDLFSMVDKVLKSEGWAETGDLIVVTAGIPTLRRGTTNMLKVHKVGTPVEKRADSWPKKQTQK